MFLYLFFLVGFGSSEKSVLIIGGNRDHGDTLTVEQFIPSKMTTTIIATSELNENEHNYLHVTAINATHAFILYDNKERSSYIDKAGILTPGPTVDQRWGPAVTSIPGKNGQMRPIYCGGENLDDGDGYVRDCQVMSADGQRFEHHSTMLGGHVWGSLTTFGDKLIAIGLNRSGMYVERYEDEQWTPGRPAPVDRSDSATVKLNETSILTCGDDKEVYQQKCLIYHVDIDKWTNASDMKTSGYEAEMVLIGQTVHAFGGSASGAEDCPKDCKRIQTLDMSGGVESAQWKLEGVELKNGRNIFGVWVIDSTELETSQWSAASVIFLM